MAGVVVWDFEELENHSRADRKASDWLKKNWGPCKDNGHRVDSDL